VTHATAFFRRMVGSKRVAIGAVLLGVLALLAIFAELLAVGLEPADIGALERLDDPAVRRRLGTHTSDFLHSDRKNVVSYLLAWADLLGEELARQRPLATQRLVNSAKPWDEWLGDGALPAAAE